MAQSEILPPVVHDVLPALTDGGGASGETWPAQLPVKRGRGRPPKNKNGAPCAPGAPGATKKETNSKEASSEGCGKACPMCSEVIVEASEEAEGHDAIFCEGASCQVWYHRWCAGVTKSRHELLAASDVPFFCPTCVVSHQSCEIASLRDAVNALMARLNGLRLRRTDEWPSAMQQPWSEVVRNGKGTGKGKGKAGRPAKRTDVNASAPSAQPSVGLTSTSRQAETSTTHDKRQSPNCHLTKRQTKPIPSKRKVWGTPKVCSPMTVKNAIIQLTGLEGNKLEVRRKYKKSDGNKVVKWWHVVNGDEKLLTLLEQNWGKVKIQTSWDLEPCLTFTDIAQDNQPSHPSNRDTDNGPHIDGSDQHPLPGNNCVDDESNAAADDAQMNGNTQDTSQHGPRFLGTN